eukprot:gene47483-biopygen33385
MCQAIINVASSSNPSSQLMETLVNTLLVSYSPTEVVSPEGTAICQQALTDIAQFAKDGLLQGASTPTSSFLVQTASNFVAPAHSSGDGSAISSSVGNIIEGGGYVQMSVMTWDSNPFPGTNNVTTPLLRMDATSSSMPFGSNETFPECRMYNGFAYVPCNG